MLAWLLQTASPDRPVVRCEIAGDPQARVYELQRSSGSGSEVWTLTMRSPKAGSPVRLPLPNAKPSVTDTSVALDYRTLNGGREVHLKVGASGATLDVHANFELEVNVEADLDPRVELMNTDGPIANLTCTIGPNR